MSLLSRIQSTAIIVSQLAALRRDGHDESTNCAGVLLEQHAASHGDQTALKWTTRRYSWQEFNEEANRIAAMAKDHGLDSGDCVALCMENCPEALFAMAGLNKIGVVTAVLNPQLTGAPLAHVLGQCAPRIVIAEPATLAAVREALAAMPTLQPLLASTGNTNDGAAPVPTLESLLPARAGNPAETTAQRGRDLMLYLFTSGTTGLPKAALIRNRRFLTMAHGFAGLLMQARRSDVIYLALPLYHATGAIAAWGSSLVSGAAMAMRRKFSATEFWDDCVRYQATIFNYIGEVCRYLLAAPPHPLERSHRLRLAVGAGLRADVWRAFQARFAMPRIVEFYGSTEGNVGMANLENKPGMIGRLLPGQRVVRVDPVTEQPVRNADGHLVAVDTGQRGMLIGKIAEHARFDGYLESKRNDDKILRDAFGDGSDWFNTGDLVQLHPRRWVSFADRLGDTYRWKGENISTNEVADLLGRFPGVSEANVYGVEVPNAEGRAGMVALVPASGFRIEDFSTEMKSRVPSPLRPAFVRLQPAMKTTASFKHVKTHLQKEGFDPAQVSDPLFYLDLASGNYLPLDEEGYRRIAAGEIRL